MHLARVGGALDREVGGALRDLSVGYLPHHPLLLRGQRKCWYRDGGDGSYQALKYDPAGLLDAG